MRRLFRSLRARLLLSHLAVVVIGLVVLLLAGRELGSLFVGDHLRSMGGMMRGMGMEGAAQLEDGINSAFNRALLWAALFSGGVAAAAASFAAYRVLRPLDEVRRVARRLATGSYSERVPEPQESELAALVADVNALAATLQETEQRRLRLVSEVSHELRTPLATIKGYTEGAIDGVFQADEELLMSIGREATRLERLADDLHKLSRTEEGQIELEVEPGDLAELARRVAEHLRPQFQDQGVDLVIESTAPLPTEFDHDRMTQVFTNIIGNALTYTPSGGKVLIGGRVSDGEAHLNVTDTGRGLTPEQTPMVFERFYRADRSAPGGTGIGLTIARDIVRRHGGDIRAASDGPGCGSTFTVVMPVSPSP